MTVFSLNSLRVNPIKWSHSNNLSAVSRRIVCVFLTILCGWRLKELSFIFHPDFLLLDETKSPMQKHPSRCVLKKRCSENMQQTYCRTPLSKCDFSKVAKQLYWNCTSVWCSPLNLLHIFRTPILKNTSKRLLLHMVQAIRITRCIMFSSTAWTSWFIRLFQFVWTNKEEMIKRKFKF